jgi:hypothetical protein
MTITDCIVLNIAATSGSQVFIIYDCKTRLYEIRGKNDDVTAEYSYYLPYSFSCEMAKHLSEFIHNVFYYENNKVTLYNCDQLPETSEDITFEFLDENLRSRNEIFSYLYKSFSKKSCKKLLKIMRHIYNEY